MYSTRKFCSYLEYFRYGKVSDITFMFMSGLDITLYLPRPLISKGHVSVHTYH